MLKMPQLSLIIAKNNKLKTPIYFMQFNVMMLGIWLIIIIFFFLRGCAIKNGLSILWGCRDI